MHAGQIHPCALFISKLTEELLVLVRGKVIRWEELTSDGQVSWAVTRAWML